MFRAVAVLTAVICLALFGVLLTNGGQYVATFAIAPDQGADFVARRAAPVFVGLAVILWMLRDLPVGTARDGICIGMIVLWLGIAVTGVFEFASGQAGAAILIASAAEVLGALAFWVARRR
ncbi:MULTISPECIES: hypothetical protein [unclassified Yoonia]|uniref:hypothetical protein n=1 Tax=unclassified Yoonia TaxID=2629118 RepID=UPI002AFF66C7|nr:MULTISPECIES: hypothetical protein [unclassified Yoonia]